MSSFLNDNTDDEALNRRERFIQLALKLVKEKDYDSLKALCLDLEEALGDDKFSRSQAHKIFKAIDIKLVDENGTGKKVVKYTGTPILNSIISPQGYFKRIYFTINPSYGKLMTEYINSYYPRNLLNAIAIDNMLICFYNPEKQKTKKKNGEVTVRYSPSQSNLKNEIVKLLNDHFINII